MRCNVSLSSARVSGYTTAKDDTTTGQWAGRGHIIVMVQWGEISGHERVCGLPLTSQGYGFSLVCTLMCVSSLYLALKGVSFLGQSWNTSTSWVPETKTLQGMKTMKDYGS